MQIIDIQEFDTFKVMNLNGDFVGVDEVNQLREVFKEIAILPKNKVIINLQNVSYLNSTALGALLSANALFEKSGGKIVICNASDYIVNIFSITKLTFIFTLYPTLEDAIKVL